MKQTRWHWRCAGWRRASRMFRNRRAARVSGATRWRAREGGCDGTLTHLREDTALELRLNLNDAIEDREGESLEKGGRRGNAGDGRCGVDVESGAVQSWLGRAERGRQRAGSLQRSSGDDHVRRSTAGPLARSKAPWKLPSISRWAGARGRASGSGMRCSLGGRGTSHWEVKGRVLWNRLAAFGRCRPNNSCC